MSRARILFTIIAAAVAANWILAVWLGATNHPGIIVVAARPIAAEATLARDDLRLELARASSGTNVVRDPDLLVGFGPKHPLAEGTRITWDDVEPPRPEASPGKTARKNGARGDDSRIGTLDDGPRETGVRSLSHCSGVVVASAREVFCIDVAGQKLAPPPPSRVEPETVPPGSLEPSAAPSGSPTFTVTLFDTLLGGAGAVGRQALSLTTSAHEAAAEFLKQFAGKTGEKLAEAVVEIERQTPPSMEPKRAPDSATKDHSAEGKSPLTRPHETHGIKEVFFFDVGKWDLEAESMARLGAIAQKMKSDARACRIEVRGYTDRSGSVRQNLWLSWRRATAVAATLMDEDVPAERLVVIPRGNEGPRLETDAEARQNRRVEVETNC
jgi:outer membrane protein OmpA-like peptidoglycan-associated protein